MPTAEAGQVTAWNVYIYSKKTREFWGLAPCTYPRSFAVPLVTLTSTVLFCL